MGQGISFSYSSSIVKHFTMYPIHTLPCTPFSKTDEVLDDTMPLIQPNHLSPNPLCIIN
jgi:hypothetical protein